MKYALLNIRKKNPRPLVGFPTVKTFNETVAMDSKQCSFCPNIWLLHLVDHATRFSMSCIIKTGERNV